MIIKNDIIILILNRFEYIIKNIGKNTKIKPNIISITINNNGYLWNIPKEWAKKLLNLDLDLTFFNINGIFLFEWNHLKLKYLLMRIDLMIALNFYDINCHLLLPFI